MIDRGRLRGFLKLYTRWRSSRTGMFGLFP